MDIDALLKQMQKSVPQANLSLIRRAYEVANLAHENQKRASGEPYVQHSLAVAQYLVELCPDSPTIAAGLLHDVVEDSILSVEDLRQEFGDEIARLVDGVTKLSEIGKLSQMGRRDLHDQEAESLRKMFLAMVDDVRVVLIKLADRLHNMHTLAALPEDRRRRIAKETLDIFAPLANRLGIWQVKWELEDLGFRHLYSEKYKEIASLIDERRFEREEQLAVIEEKLLRELKEDGIEAEVSGRPKHIYSIYRKMERKGLPFDQIYDVRGVRIVVDDIPTCYAVLGIVHSLWRPIPGQFDDFIATPKDNMYQSLHTAVVADDGRTLEVQIRTRDMHRIAEYGVAAHWRYKEQARRDMAFEAKIAWLRSLMEWRQDVTDAQEFVDSLKSDVFKDRVYTFTPRGDVVDLPNGATPIDFAYHIHTEIGHRCRGAKVNGRLVGLDYQLQNGDQVEILTAKRGGPSRDWLNLHLNYTKTARARQKIRQWFRRQDRAENIAQGRELLVKELRRLNVEQESYEDLARLFNYDKVDDFLAAIGYGDISAQRIATRVLEAELERTDQPIHIAPVTTAPVSPPEIRVRGVGSLLTRLAGCCHPLPGDDIVGYITRGRGVTIHRCDCPNILRTSEQERLIEVDWGPAVKTYPVRVVIRAYDRGGLLRDIGTVVAGENVNMTAANITTQAKKNTATIAATLEITDISQLSRVLAKIEQVHNVVEARRQIG
ncbi:MAG: bifunctional (p)ppGpp synthetase/guanosine-3',5'-bis(diphosphate) 3'-pyrophosphohydrolase [Chloroflexota bacterium]|nr:bifunctional (p)ppGpp synthetase/guanosine-3',5'-bis(diphosphate) 3'-pyrophosphohydrolase [Chloroflexota bacterium]